MPNQNNEKSHKFTSHLKLLQHTTTCLFFSATLRDEHFTSCQVSGPIHAGREFIEHCQAAQREKYSNDQGPDREGWILSQKKSKKVKQLITWCRSCLKPI